MRIQIVGNHDANVLQSLQRAEAVKVFAVPTSWKQAHPLAPWVPYHVKLKEAYERIKAEG